MAWMLMSMLRRLPMIGGSLIHQGLKIKIIEIEERRVTKVSLHKV
ncbi:hypothetical protein HBR94_04050 [Pseudomonas sp. WS 5412]|nr:hypothetical protein [Pseudomonas sp. WS 5412]